MRIIHADLHIHSCLSPCAELEMSPRGIVQASISSGLDMIAICDHNSAENVAAVMEAASQTSLQVLPGMEITSKEEVHVVGLFRCAEDALRTQDLIYEHLEGTNDETVFGEQVIVAADGTVMGFNDRLLIGATDLSLEDIVQSIHQQGGLAIAAHIDREGFGIIGQLGFIPPKLNLDALEISSRVNLHEISSMFEPYLDYPFITSSDAHVLADVGSARTPLRIEGASFKELQKALRGEDGRSIQYEG